MKINQAVILAGGRGKRLRPITDNIPKTMVKIHKEKPFISYIIDQINSFGISEIIIFTGYKSNLIKNYFKNNKQVSVIKNRNSLLTGSRLLENYHLLRNKFLLLYSDNYLNFNFKNYKSSYEYYSKKSLHLLVQHKSLAKEEGNILKQKNDLRYFSIRSKKCQYVEMGYMLFSKKILKYYYDNRIGNISLSKILENYIKPINTSIFLTKAKYNSITDVNSLKKTKKNLK